MDITTKSLMKPLGVQGVGENAQQCIYQAQVPIQLSSGSAGSYTAPVIGSDACPSNVPALLGLQGMTTNRTIIDLTTDKMYLCGPGDPEINLPPGSLTLQMERSPSRHLILPSMEFQKMQQHQAKSKKSVAFTVDSSTTGPTH